MDIFKIGDTFLHWRSPYELAPGRFMELFRCQGSCGQDDIYISACFEPLQPYTQYPCLGSQELYDVYDVSGEKLLLYHWGYQRNAYGVWIDRIRQGREDCCSFDPEIVNNRVLNADWFFGVCGLQRALLHRGWPVLHASYIDCNGKAILFTAPSETGKSTQAELWRLYAGAQVINGDRALLGRRGERWFAHGFPACGSSGVCIDRSLPIEAIVVLVQGKENEITQLSAGEKLRALVTATVQYRGDGEDFDMALELAQQIAAQVPMVRLSCRPDRQAVEVLRQYLENSL